MSVFNRAAQAAAKLSRPPTWRGRVFSDRMNKSVTVVVARQTFDPAIGKYVRKLKKFMAHDEHNECRIGDVVEIELCQRMSKHKSFIVKQILQPFRRGTDPLVPVAAQQPTIVPERVLAPRVLFPQDVAAGASLEPVPADVFSPFIAPRVEPIRAKAAAAAALNAAPATPLARALKRDREAHDTDKL